MTGEILIGFDLGTTVLKAAAIDAGSGKVLAQASARLPVSASAGGKREQDVDAVIRALGRSAASLRRKLGKSWVRACGVGLAAQGGSAIIADRITGQAHTPMQLWSDTRPLGLLAEIAARKPAGYWRRVSFLDEPGAGLARLAWLRQRRPKLFEEAATSAGGRDIYVGAGEYVYFHLAGLWRQDAGNALQIGCYDARRRRVSAGPLELVGVSPSFVAPMREQHRTNPLSSTGAKLLGLPEGLLVAGPYMDHEAGYLSVSSSSHRALQISLGTAWVGNFVLAEATPPPGFNLVLPSPVGDGSLVVRVMRAGNATWDWATATFMGGAHSTSLARAEEVFDESLLPPAGLVSLPWLTQPNPLCPSQTGAGGMLGVNAHTTRADMLRAVAAGMCYELARVFEPVLQAGLIDRVILSGGAANGGHFRSILAGLFAPLPVLHVPADESLGARGTLYAFSRRAAKARTIRQPRPSRADCARIAKGYHLYRRTCEALSKHLPG